MLSLRKLTYASSISLLIAGCGDASAPDCEGHGHSGGALPAGCEFLEREGGELRMEYRLLPDLTEVAVAQAWFVNNQNPVKLPAVTFNECTDVSKIETNITPKMETIMSRQFYDVGDSITINGGGAPIVITKHLNTPDFRGAMEGEIYVKDMKAQGSVPVADVTRGAEYSATFGNGTVLEEKLYMPKDWTPTSGPLFNGTPYQVVKGQDLVWNFDPVDPNDDAPIAFLYFVAKDGSSRWFCPFDENPTSITIPSSVVDQFGTEGSVLGAVLRHKRANLNDRNFDVIGINCKIQSFTNM